MFTIGADPEMFLKDITTGKVVACIGLLGGTKEEPIPVKNGAVQEDNVMAEFNIDPASDETAFVNNILSVRKQIRDTVKNFNLTEHIVASAHFPLEELGHPQAQTFGCDPDFNAWTGEQNPRPEATDPTLRTAGGHIHVGYDFSGTPDSRANLIKWMDLLIGIPSILFDPDSERRQLYGKAGAHRRKPYGVEYRVVSNFWIKDADKIKWVYRQTERAIAMSAVDKFNKVTGDLVQRAINTSDKNLAAYLIEVNNIDLRGLL